MGQNKKQRTKNWQKQIMNNAVGRASRSDLQKHNFEKLLKVGIVKAWNDLPER